MSDFQPTVNDLALFFCDDQGQVQGHWIPYDVYKSTPLGAMDDVWKRADLFENPAPGGGVFYVANLGNLLGPGQPIGEVERAPAAAAASAARTAAPAAKDLVVIPYQDPPTAYIVPRAVYSDETRCPPVRGPSASTIITMALNQGVVLANLPKSTGVGWTCYLLSLLSLKSGAVHGLSTADKNEYFAKLPHRAKSETKTRA